MFDPVSAGLIVVKEAAEKAVLAVKESLKITEGIREGVGKLKISETKLSSGY